MTDTLPCSLDAKIASLATWYRPLAVAILKEAIRIPADHVDLPLDQGGDSLCGTSNHEGPRIEYLRRALIEIGGVRSESDVVWDQFGNLVWSVEDPANGIPAAEKRVILFDGHCDTVRALRPQWRTKLGPGVDPYLGLTDSTALDREALRKELGYVPPESEWPHLLFGRGSADQLGGVVAQMVASKILLELASAGALRGAIVRGMITVAEEDNDGGGPHYFMTRVLPGAAPEQARMS